MLRRYKHCPKAPKFHIFRTFLSNHVIFSIYKLCKIFTIVLRAEIVTTFGSKMLGYIDLPHMTTFFSQILEFFYFFWEFCFYCPNKKIVYNVNCPLHNQYSTSDVTLHIMQCDVTRLCIGLKSTVARTRKPCVVNLIAFLLYQGLFKHIYILKPPPLSQCCPLPPGFRPQPQKNSFFV